MILYTGIACRLANLIQQVHGLWRLINCKNCNYGFGFRVSHISIIEAKDCYCYCTSCLCDCVCPSFCASIQRLHYQLLKVDKASIIKEPLQQYYWERVLL